jgi:hypothetical protein
MIKVAEGVYECDIDKECMYKDEYGKMLLLWCSRYLSLPYG